MFFTTKTYYSLIAILEIARRYFFANHSEYEDKPEINHDNGSENRPSTQITLAEISQKHEINHQYLEQLTSKLRRANLIRAIKGPGGGYSIAKEPRDISLYDIAEAIDDDIRVTRCKNGDHGCISKDKKCISHNILIKIEEAVIDKLKEIDLESMVKTSFEKDFEPPGLSQYAPIGAKDNLTEITSKQGENAIEDANRVILTSNAFSIFENAADALKNVVYLDHNATSIIHPSTLFAMNRYSYIPLNPSAPHAYGNFAASFLSSTKKELFYAIFRTNEYFGTDLMANACDTLSLSKKYNIIFTSSATESNNIILSSFKDLISMCMEAEHSSIREYASKENRIPLDRDGIISIDMLREIIKRNKNISPSSPQMLSIAYANGDIGVIQPIKEIAEICREQNVMLHLDITQSLCRMRAAAMNLAIIQPDFVSMSFHKVGGPQGIGALIYNKKHTLKPITIGGGQEDGIRSGTQNMQAICGLSGFLSAIHDIEDKYNTNIVRIRDYLRTELKRNFPSVIIFGENSKSISNTSCFSFCDIASSTQIAHFDLQSVAVSSGAACLSRRISENATVRAMGYDEKAGSAIRVSLGYDTKMNDIDKFIQAARHLTSIQ